MIKSFAVALFGTAAHAIQDSAVRGANDGSDRENALYTSFVNSDSCGNNKYVKLDMWTHIRKVPDEDAYEYHGETVAYIEGPVGRYMQYGMCIEIGKDPAS